MVFSPEELLIIWRDLERIPDTDNSDIRQRIKQFLEDQRARQS